LTLITITANSLIPAARHAGQAGYRDNGEILTFKGVCGIKIAGTGKLA